MQRLMCNKHNESPSFTPFRAMPFSLEKCQRFRFQHPFTSMIAGMTRSGKKGLCSNSIATSFRDNLPSPGEDRLVLFTMAACVHRNASRQATH